MDKTLVCGTEAPGSIPGGSTHKNAKILTKYFYNVLSVVERFVPPKNLIPW